MPPPLVLAVTSVKPFGGRSTAALMLAWAVGRAGRRTLLVDANRYPALIPRKSETGSAELWPNVVLGSRKPGEAMALGSELVIVDAPPLVEERATKILGGADAVLVSLFPIVQNKRFLKKAKATLAKLEAEHVLGWFSANADPDNPMHQGLVENLRVSLADWEELTSVPAGPDVPEWKAMAAEEPPEGPFRDAFVTFASSLLDRLGFSGQEAAGGEGHDGAGGTEESEPSELPSTPAESSADVRGSDREPVEGVSTSPAGHTPSESAASNSENAAQPPPPSVGASSQPAPPTLVAEAATPDLPAFRWFGTRPTIRLALVDLEARFSVRSEVTLFPLGLPLVAAGPMLRWGLLHSLDPARILGTSDRALRRFRPSEESITTREEEFSVEKLVPNGERLHVGDDVEGALEDFERNRDGDSRLIRGLLRLTDGDHAAARSDIEGSIAEGPALGSDLARLGRGLLVDVSYGNGVTTHFGSNLRGARLAMALTCLFAGDEEGGLVELERVCTMDPEDPVLTTIRAELLLQRGGEDDLREAHRSALVPCHDTPVHVVLALYRAEALFRLGYGEGAHEGLGHALEGAPRGSPMRRALLSLRAHVAACIGRSRDARRDLETLYAEDPDDETVALRLAS